jgi:3-oxoacyl-[acyl-carrier-protein] synthase II
MRPGARAVSGPLEDAGSIVTTGIGGLQTVIEQFRVLNEKGPDRVSPFMVPMMMPNAATAAVSMRFGLGGPCETVTTACAAGTHAIGNAARLIATGRCDVAVAGGAEAVIVRSPSPVFQHDRPQQRPLLPTLRRQARRLRHG